jgi:competence protein ComEA
MAGGLCPDAASENINMVYCLDQPVSIYIPSITEENTSESVRVKLPSSGFFREDVNQYIWGREDDDGSEYSQDAESSGKININSADEDALMRLSGVGEVTAAAIIRYRSEHGLFEKIEDIMKVPGIKQGRFDAIKDMIVV